MKPLLLYNHSGFENRGCEAIIESTVSLFEGRVPSITIASFTPEYDRAHTDGHKDRNIIDTKISPYSPQRFINSVGFRLGQPRETEVARLYSPVIRTGARSICLSVGGDTYCYAYQEHMHVINKRLKEKHAPLVLWGCSIDPERIRDEVLDDLRVYDLILPRESLSAEALEGNGFPVMRWIDPAFLLEKRETPVLEGWQPGSMIGLNVSPLVLDKNGSHERSKESICILMDTILRDTDFTIALIPHVTWAHDNDMALLSELAGRYSAEKRVLLIPGTLSAMEYKYLVSQMQGIITARTHLSIAAYSTGVPALVIGYSIKARGIARDIYGDPAGHLYPADQLEDCGALLRCAEEFLGRLTRERMYLEEKMKTYIGGVTAVADRVLSL